MHSRFYIRPYKLAGNRNFDYIAAVVYGFILVQPVQPRHTRAHRTCTHLFIRSKNVNLSNPFTFYILYLANLASLSLPDPTLVSPGGLINFDVSSFFAARRYGSGEVGRGSAYQLHKLICIRMHLNGLRRRVYTPL